MKTSVFNLIILDESGSMGGVTAQTISGCNETLNTIRSSARQHAETMQNFVSIYAFQNGGDIKSRYLVKNAKPENVADVTAADYRPWGNTPLLDAVGSTLTELEAIADTHEDATGIITIMTDGYENSSRLYNWQKVAAIIDRFREKGWTVNLIGADIDIDAMSKQLHVDSANAMAYDKSCSPMMWDNFSANIASRLDEEAEFSSCDGDSIDERRNKRKVSSKSFFKK